MKLYAVLFLVCLMLAGAATAKQATTDIGISVAKPDIPSGAYTLTGGVSYCSEDGASAGTPTYMGELDITSTPAGASVSIDGSPWTYKHCIGGWPTPTCLYLPVNTPYTGRLETGTHAITIALTGYKNYVGTVHICSQNVTYVHKTLTAITTTTPTTTVTTTATTTAATTATTAVTTTTTTATTTSAATTSATTPATTSTTGTATTAASVPATTTSVAGTVIPVGSGSLSVTTIPAGAAVYIDGVQRGVSPAVIPGLAEGSHTVFLRLDGYQDLSTPVSITAGTMNEFSTGLTPLPAGGTAVPVTTAAGAAAVPAKTQSPGFEAAAAACVVGILLLLRKTNH